MVFTSRNDNSCGGRASELESDKFICTYLGKANHLLPGPSRRLAPVIKCNAFLCFQSYIVRDIPLTEIYRWLVTFIGILSAILKSTTRGVKRKIIAFWTTRFPAFTMY